jgi:serine/threonine protein kinase/tetratricopeptide (TPR) repeat protein
MNMESSEFDPRFFGAESSSPRTLGRFRILRRLGAGGMGTVYEAHDAETGGAVALKTLAGRSAGALEEFKREFRRCQDLAHENLVSLGELFVENDLWYFTMELVRGEEFLQAIAHNSAPEDRFQAGRNTPGRPDSFSNLIGGSQTLALPPLSRADEHGRPSPVGLYHPVPFAERCDAKRLRRLLIQLVRALRYLHDAGKIHRDVKSSNVLVTDRDRLVLIDFGIAVDSDPARRQGRMAGTPLTIAPEHAAGRRATAASDFYAVGILLYQVLAGRDPFEGTLQDVLAAKRRGKPRRREEFAADAPDDLIDLAMALLSPTPEARPDAESVLAVLEAGLSLFPPSLGSAPIAPTDEEIFVGRQREMDVLYTTFGAVRAERERILRNVLPPVATSTSDLDADSHRPSAPPPRSERGERQPTPIVLLEGESGIGKSHILNMFRDQLSARRPAPLVLAGRCHPDEAVPFNAFDRIFAQIAQWLDRFVAEDVARFLTGSAWTLAESFPVLVPLLERIDLEEPTSPIDPIERRREAFAQARELFARIAREVPVVLAFDDFQWADDDSRGLLAALLRRPTPIGLFVVVSARERPESRVFADVSPEVIVVGPLPRAECLAFVEAAVARGAHPEDDVDAIVEASSGHPFLLDELLRSSRLATAGTSGEHRLVEALLARVDSLEDDARRMLEALSLAIKPLPQPLIAQVAGVDPSIAFKHVKRMKLGRLVKLDGLRATDPVEPYHGKVREAVRSRLDDEARRRLHRRLGEAFASREPVDDDALFFHFAGAEDHARARPLAIRLAEGAERALAFDRAANAYRYLLRRAEAEGRSTAELLVSLATALANGGRAREAADLFLRAATVHGGRRGRVLRRRAAETLLRAGYIDDGERQLNGALDDVGLPLVRPFLKVPMFLFSRGRLALRGRAYRLRTEEAIELGALERIDTAWAAACGFLMSDQLRGFVYHAENLRLSLDAGEPKRLIRALGMEAIFLSTRGEEGERDGDGLLEEADRLVAQHGDAYSAAWISTARCMSQAVRGHWDQVALRAVPALLELEKHNVGAHWEIGTVRQNELWAFGYVGEFARLEDAVERARLAARAIGDKFAETALRVGVPNLVHLFRDDPVGARRDAEDATASWALDGFHLQHLQSAWSRSISFLYEGDLSSAQALLRETDARYEGSGLDKLRPNRILAVETRGRVGLAVGDDATVVAAIAALRGENVPWATGLAAAFAYARAVGRNDGSENSFAEQILGTLDEAKLGSYRFAIERAIAWRSGDWAGVERAELAVSAQRIARPERFLDAFLPIPSLR